MPVGGDCGKIACATFRYSTRYSQPNTAKHPMHDVPKAICGAKTRSGKPCQSSPVSGKRRCRMHGGATPTGRQQGPIRHGIYSKRLTDEERSLLPTIPVGTLDAEIIIARIILHRLIAMHDEIQAAPNDPKNMAGFRNEVSIERPDGTTYTMRVPDTFGLMDRCLGRIARLELTRARLIASMRERGEGAEWQPLAWVDWMPQESPSEAD